MMLTLRFEPQLRQVPRLQLKLQHVCAICRMALPGHNEQLSSVLDIILGLETLSSPYQLCFCGRIQSESFTKDRNYRARWRRRRTWY